MYFVECNNNDWKMAALRFCIFSHKKIPNEILSSVDAIAYVKFEPTSVQL